MALLVWTLVDGYRDIMDNKSDPRVKDWPLMESPLPTLCICLAYAYFVKVLGPKLMENRKPFNLTRILIVYNLAQVLFSVWLFRESILGGWFTHYSFKCQPVDYSNNATALRMARGCWWYYISKFTEFFDTIFFVLRKKNNHISTLHVIHHGIMPLSVWFGVKFTPGGHSSFFGFLNTLVHIVMYTYYLLAAMGPRMQKYLWWKKYLTTFQMVQFILVMLHAFQLLFIECDYPKAFAWWIGLHAVMFYFLFSDFYKQTYMKKTPKKIVQANGGVSNKSNGICFTSQTPLYETSQNVKGIARSYTSESNAELRHRAFIDSACINAND